jgi:site-specific DNA-methyltransferase (adenine-specific)
VNLQASAIYCQATILKIEGNLIMSEPHQVSMFGPEEPRCVSISDAANTISVSQATVRNWLKAGHISQTSKGLISLKSIETFKSQVDGTKRLTKRANKTAKDTHDHALVSKKLESRLASPNFNSDQISQQYEESLSESFRNIEGIYYTPPSIVTKLFGIGNIDFSNSTFCDPCCGSGNFLVRALELGFKPENVYGFDTDPNAVAISKRRILAITGQEPSNVSSCDFLSESIRSPDRKFDFIFTNPPWGKKISKEEKERMGRLFKVGKNLDTSALFFFACLGKLREGGELGLLLPDAFFNISTFEEPRAHALEHQITRLIDFEKPFKGLVTKAVGLTLKKSRPTDKTMISCETGSKVHFRLNSSFAKNPKRVLNFQTSPISSQVIDHIYSLPHTTLKGKAEWGLGIVTGDNSKHCKSEYEEGLIPVFRGADLNKSTTCTPSLYVPSDLSQYQQVAPKRIYEAKEKLIYKFISSDLCFFHDEEQRYALNSANILVPNSSLEISAKQLCDMLNSELMNWLFKSIFMTHKVLRSDLEELPIFTSYFCSRIAFDEKAFLNHLSLEQTQYGTYGIKRKDH